MKTTLALVGAVALAGWGCDVAQNVTCFEFDGEQVCVEDANPNQCGGDELSYGLSTSPSAWNNGVELNGIYPNALNAYLNMGNGEAIRGTTLVGVWLGRPRPMPTHRPSPQPRAETGVQAGDQLLGATDADEILVLDVTARETDPADSSITYYQVALAGGGNLCGVGGKGQLVPGVWDASGARHDSVTVDGRVFDHTFSCTNGVIAKCVRWGYDPKKVGAEVHATCTRMARADYCGDGVPHTENGTLIDIADQSGINALSDDTGEFVFEAGWGPDGAVCVHKPRYYDLDRDNQAMAPSCWSDLPRCDSWQAAQEQGALTGNASRPAIRHFCD